MYPYGNFPIGFVGHRLLTGPQGELPQGWTSDSGGVGRAGSLQGLPKLGEAGGEGVRERTPSSEPAAGLRARQVRSKTLVRDKTEPDSQLRGLRCPRPAQALELLQLLPPGAPPCPAQDPCRSCQACWDGRGGRSGATCGGRGAGQPGPQPLEVPGSWGGRACCWGPTLAPAAPPLSPGPSPEASAVLTLRAPPSLRAVSSATGPPRWTAPRGARRATGSRTRLCAPSRCPRARRTAPRATQGARVSSRRLRPSPHPDPGPLPLRSLSSRESGLFLGEPRPSPEKPSPRNSRSQRPRSPSAPGQTARKAAAHEGHPARHRPQRLPPPEAPPSRGF